MQEFPKMLYPPQGKAVVVHDATAEARARAAGFAMLHEAPEPAHTLNFKPADFDSLDKDALIAAAKELGLDVDKRRSLDTLRQMVADALAPRG